MPSRSHRFYQALIVGALISLLALLFIGSPDYYDSRTVKEVWESGHFALFFLIVIAARQVLNHLSLGAFFIRSLVFGLVFGLATETLQLAVGRSFEWKDLINDLLGVASACCLIMGIENRATVKKIAAFAGLIFISVIGTRSVIVSVYDDYLMSQQFPVLSNFETAFQLSRWDYAWAELSATSEVKFKGSKSMKVEFMPGPYPDITLNHFVHDWSSFRFIELSLFNPSTATYNLVLKIYDKEHVKSQYEFGDRFNQDIRLVPGWNHIKYPLEAVFHAPKNRVMDSVNVSSFSLFAINVEETFVFYIDEVKLSNH